MRPFWLSAVSKMTDPALRRLAPASLHVDLDGAWSPEQTHGLPTLDLRPWGPRLRFCAPTREIEEFFVTAASGIPRVTRFLLFGSGDFHHLSALWLRRLAGAEPALTLVSFDNHPDWDIRPPTWCCGSWVNRALELPNVRRASVWGLGNFETWGWHRLTGNRRDVRRGRLEVHAWADDRSPADQAQAHAIRQDDWRERFERFADTLKGKRLYVTIDLDCLREGAAATDWENGRFTLDDVRWALATLRARGGNVVAGDLCGARSAPRVYDRWTQRFASESDHPKTLPPPADPAEAARVNAAAFRALWPALTGADQDHARRDQQ